MLLGQFHQSDSKRAVVFEGGAESFMGAIIAEIFGRNLTSSILILLLILGLERSVRICTIWKFFTRGEF